MNKKLVMKTFSMSKKSKDKWSSMMVVGYNTSKVNGGYLDKIGVFGTFNKSILNMKPKIVCTINLKKMGYWLNKGAIIKSKPSWLLGLILKNDK